MPAHDDLGLIEHAAREAGVIAKRYFGGDYRRWDKGKGQPVTEADLAIDDYLRTTLSIARPAYGWLSEESEDDPARLATELTFVVDPIDGTTAFLKGRPHFSISIAIVHDGRPVTAVVFNPITDEYFTAAKDTGARLNGAFIHASSRAEIEGCRMLAPKMTFEHPVWSTPPHRPWPPMEVENRNSIAYRLALVAADAFDSMLALSPKHDWDLAAGDLIAREAGCVVSDHLGQELRYNGKVPVQRSIVAANPVLHAALIERLEPLGPLSR